MKKLELELSPQAVDLLKQMAEYGVYGTTKEEVAARLVDRGLIERLGNPHLNLKLKRPKKVTNAKRTTLEQEK